MFIPRQELADNGEINRQTIIQHVVLFGKQPHTPLERCAAAIYGSRYIDVLSQAKILKHLDDILGYIDVNNANDCQAALKRISVRKRVRDYVNTLRLDIGDPIYLHRMLPILSVHPEKPEHYSFTLETAPSSISTIAEFEYLVFNNFRKYRYLGGTSFAGYVYQNILYSLNANSIDELEDNDAWQARLAILLYATDLNDYVARNAFYDNEVRYRGIDYDTSFVPNYDVNALVPQQPLTTVSTHLQQIRYRNSIDVTTTKTIPLENMAIFLVFPFLNGHYIKPNGRIVYLNLNAQCKKSVRFIMNDLCHTHDLEYAVESASRNLKLDDVIYFAIYSETLQMQALALLVLRSMIGNYLTVNKYTIRIPNALTILSWTSMTCQPLTSIILPSSYSGASKAMDEKINLYASLIRDIAKSCFSTWNASMICSSYNIPEYILKPCYDRLRNDAEKYIFLTMLLQDYNYASYSAARNRLKPNFGQEKIDLSKYPVSGKMYNDSTLGERLKDLTEPLVRPTNINDGITTSCPPYKCIDMFEFEDLQLRMLVRNEDPQLTNDQLANYIALSLNT